MGDVVNIITVPKQKSIFYKITSGCLRFQVRGPSNAGIGLSKSPHNDDVLWVVVTRNGYTTIGNSVGRFNSVLSENPLSAGEFQEFWLQWHSGKIYLGKDSETVPFLVHRAKTDILKYITFGVHGNDVCSLQWRFEMPPLQKRTLIKPVSDGIPQWLPAKDKLPIGAAIGGFDNEILYIIRAEHEGSLTPGKFVPSLGVGYIPWGGCMHEKTEFEVLCGFDCIWVPSSYGKVPAGAVEAGYSENSSHETLYVGRALYRDQLVPGKVQPSHKVCYIPSDNREIAIKKYEVMVVPLKNALCAKQFYDYEQARRMN